MIGIIAAMELEVTAIRREMDVTEEKTIAGVHLTYGTIHTAEVCLLKSGVGKVLAAMAAAIACMEHPLEALINVGVAGGLLPDQHVLDLVISDTAVQADFDTSALDGPEGLGLVYQADAALIEKARQAAETMQLPFTIGSVASQDLFMAREQDFARLMDLFPDSVCAEMEGAAIAAVAQQFQVPFLIIRSLSDVVGHAENPMEFSQFTNAASIRSAGLIKTILSAHPGKNPV